MKLFRFLSRKFDAVASAPHLPLGSQQSFLDALARIAPPVGNLSYRFGDADDPDGFVQLWDSWKHWLKIHRIWTTNPGEGAGSKMMQMLCDLADQHDVGLMLKVLPIGRKPYPLTRIELKHWYERFGFSGKGWMLKRHPIPKRASPNQTTPNRA